ncbi:MAG: YdcF family protein, partial [Rhodospirillaceae bacterium]
HAARLWKRGVAPRIIVSGGAFLAQNGGPPTPEADAMRVFLIDLGVPADAITDEGQALNTIENIRNVRAIIGTGRVALVTSAYHMPRALQLAKRAGLNAGAFPTDYQAMPEARLPWDNWLPSVGALSQSNLALREYVALNLDYRRSSLDR